MNEKETGISYARLAEIATRLKDMLNDNGFSNEDILDCLNEDYDLDLSEKEIEFLGLNEEADDF